MIYLMKDRDYVKIGYTVNVANRLSAFKIGNCYITLDDFKPGIKKDEKQLHQLCKAGHYRGEGFKDCPEVRKIGNEYESEQYKISLAAHQDLIKENEFIDEYLSKNHLDGYKNWPNNSIATPQIANGMDVFHLDEHYEALNLDSKKHMDRNHQLKRIIDIFNGENSYPKIFIIDNYRYTLKETIKRNTKKLELIQEKIEEQ